MTKQDQGNIALVLGVGLFIWGLAGVNREGGWSDEAEIRMAIGAMIGLSGFLWRSR